MKINRVKLKDGDELYYLADTVRKNGKVTTVNIKSLGKRSELLNEYEDPYTSLKEYAKNLTMEKMLEEEKLIVKVLQEELISDTQTSSSNLLNVGYFYISKIIDRLELKDFFKKITKNTKIEFDAYEVTKFLIIDRIINPGSKLKTYGNLENYYEQPQIELQYLYRTLDLIESNIDELQKHLYIKSKDLSERNTSILYYDCTNFYFEMKFETDFLKYGYSKEKQKKPLLGLGLFMDANGIPLAFDAYEGNISEQETLKPIEKRIIKDFKLAQLIIITDAGLSSNENRAFNAGFGREFVVTESIRKLDKETQAAIFKDDGHWIDLKDKNENKRIYTLNEIKEYEFPDKTKFKTDKEYRDSIPIFSKELIINKPVSWGLWSLTENNRATNKTDFKQRLIVTYNPLYANYQQKVRESQVEKAKKIVESKKSEYNELGSPKRYVHEEYEGYEKSIDYEQIEHDAKYDGFYAIATSLMDEPANMIIKIGSFRWKLEDLIKIMKFYLKTRPMYHRKEPRIKAHVAICYTSLLIIRLLDMMLGEKYSVEELLKQFKSMNVLPLNDAVFKATYNGSKLLTELDTLLDKKLAKSVFSNKELNKMK